MAKKRTLVSFDWAAKNLLRRKADYAILEGKAEGMAAVFALLEKGLSLEEAKRQLGLE
jgi:hypothetical protein